MSSSSNTPFASLTILFGKIHASPTTLEMVLHKMMDFTCISANKRMSVGKRMSNIVLVAQLQKVNVQSTQVQV